MSIKKLILPISFIAFVFIGFGDRFLPHPLSDISLNTRNSINNSLTGLSPSIKQQHPDGATEKAVDNLGK